MEMERFERGPALVGRTNSRAREQRAIAEQFYSMYLSPLFVGMSGTECNDVLSSSRLKKYAKNETLFHQGDPFNRLVMIQTGMVKVTQTSLSGQEVILRVIRTNDTVGLHAESPFFKHACSASAMETTKAFVWDYSDFRTIEVQYPKLTANIHSILSSRLAELETMFSEIATGSAVQRLGLTLLRLIERVGISTKDGMTVSLRREELSQMTGLTVFTISRALAKWARSGLVIPRREAILVKDLVRFRFELQSAANEKEALLISSPRRIM